MYLRKSRADMDAEMRGEGETLARHKKILLDLAKRMKISVSEIYEEIVSGDTIAARPQMQKLLSDVEQGKWTGVLVVEVERLARGDTMDQGLVSQTFQLSNTKIITLAKTYDPTNEFDEEYFEFGLFMSRREYKTINRRLQRGKIAAFQEGKYIAGTAPLGYDKVKCKDGSGNTLQINDQADIVRLIYDLYTKGELQENGTYRRLGMYRIAKKLDKLGIKPQVSDSWSSSTIKDILTNPTYTGKIRWQWRPYKKNMRNGKVVITRPKDKECPVVDGLHEPIIDQETFDEAQRILESRSNYPIVSNKTIKNPLTGLVFCGKCGKLMTRVYSNTKAGYYSLMCPSRGCDNVSAPIYLIENKIIEGLAEQLEDYKADIIPGATNPEDGTDHEKIIEQIKSELVDRRKQLEKTYDLLEKEIYDTETFLKRNDILEKNISDLEQALASEQERMEQEQYLQKANSNFVPRIQEIVKTYMDIEDPMTKNAMLKQVIDHIDYIKEKPAQKGKRDAADVVITVYPKLPKK